MSSAAEIKSTPTADLLRRRQWNLISGLYWAAFLLLMLALWIYSKYWEDGPAFMAWAVGALGVIALGAAVMNAYSARISWDSRSAADTPLAMLQLGPAVVPLKPEVLTPMAQSIAHLRTAQTGGIHPKHWQRAGGPAEESFKLLLEWFPDFNADLPVPLSTCADTRNPAVCARATFSGSAGSSPRQPTKAARSGPDRPPRGCGADSTPAGARSARSYARAGRRRA